jgi:hypothetical protein
MKQGDNVDKLIRSALQAGVQTEEPAATVRAALLTSAARHDVPRSALGPSIPAIATGLQECDTWTADWDEPAATTIPLTRRHLLLLAAPLYAVR